MGFPTIACSSSLESRRLGIPCAVSCDYLSERATEIGVLWLDLFQRCLGKTASPGAQVWRDKTSRDFEKKSEMAARLREFSRSARSSDTIRTCLREPTIHTIK